MSLFLCSRRLKRVKNDGAGHCCSLKLMLTGPPVAVTLIICSRRLKRVEMMEQCMSAARLEFTVCLLSFSF